MIARATTIQGRAVSVKWFVVRARQGQEHRAARELRNQAFPVYLPKTFTPHRTGQRVICISRLRFNAYLFVAFDPIDDDGKHDSSVYAPIFNTRGVARLFCDAHDVPVPVHDAEIRTIQQLEDEEHEIATSRNRRSRHRDEFEPGDTVQVTRGRAFGFKGQVLSYAAGKVKFLAGSAAVEADGANCALIRRADGGNKNANSHSLTRGTS